MFGGSCVPPDSIKKGENNMPPIPFHIIDGVPSYVPPIILIDDDGCIDFTYSGRTTEELMLYKGMSLQMAQLLLERNLRETQALKHRAG